MPAQSPKHKSTLHRSRPFPQTDAGNAELFTFLFKEHLRYDHARSRWLVWGGHWWFEDADGGVFRKAKHAARVRYRSALRIKDLDKRKREAKWAIQGESRHRLEAMLCLAKNEKPLADPGTNWDLDPWRLGVANGVVNLRTGKLSNGQPEDRITLHTETPFDPAAKCPRFELFLREVFRGIDEIIAFVQRAIGYSLTGCTSEQCLFLCFGDGANGKSTFLEVLRCVLGDHAYNLPFSAFEMKARSSIPNEIAALKGKRFVTAIETDESVRLNESRIKALTGCDRVTARFLYREFFGFDPTAKPWLAFNHRPTVVDDSHGFWRRIRPISFPEDFTDRADKELLSKLKAEGPGILAWAVRGCLAWQKEGLGMPPRMENELRAYREENDLIGEFIDERCHVHPAACVTSADLWQEYADWTNENGEPRLDRKAFAHRLERKGFNRRKIGHGSTRGWAGLCRKVDAEAQGVADVRTRADASSDVSANTNRIV